MAAYEVTIDCLVKMRKTYWVQGNGKDEAIENATEEMFNDFPTAEANSTIIDVVKMSSIDPNHVDI